MRENTQFQIWLMFSSVGVEGKPRRISYFLHTGRRETPFRDRAFVLPRVEMRWRNTSRLLCFLGKEQCRPKRVIQSEKARHSPNPASLQAKECSWTNCLVWNGANIHNCTIPSLSVTHQPALQELCNERPQFWWRPVGILSINIGSSS